MNTSFEKNNIVIIKGKIDTEPEFSHSVLGEGFYSTKIRVERLSSEFDLIPVTISERLMGNLKVGDVVALKGQFRSYNKMVDGKSKLMLTMFARELIDSETTYETNQINLVGYVCKEPIFRTTPFGREICDILIAVNRAYNKSDYIPCIAWGRNARFSMGLAVGEKIELVGRIQSRNYQKKIDENTTETRTAYEISISSILLADTGEEYSLNSQNQSLNNQFNSGDNYYSSLNG
ncbi:MAG: single-stranded DNA-binding protein [Clostridia bacterium]|nr:single-stranded DNA-binding protein [Clostridia bacterium]